MMNSTSQNAAFRSVEEFRTTKITHIKGNKKCKKKVRKFDVKGWWDLLSFKWY